MKHKFKKSLRGVSNLNEKKKKKLVKSYFFIQLYSILNTRILFTTLMSF